MNEIKDTQGDLLGGLVELGLLGSLQEGLSLAGTGAGTGILLLDCFTRESVQLCNLP
jgi:hypothetical protein